MYFVQNVKYLMDDKRWSKADLARATNISPPVVGRYVDGERQPKIEAAIAIAKGLDVNLDDLLLTDLSQSPGRPFGATGEDTETADETLLRMNALLEQRLRMVEAALKRSDPDKAKEFGIE